MISYHTKDYVQYKQRIQATVNHESLMSLNNAIMSDKNITDSERWELYRTTMRRKEQLCIE